MCGAFRHLPSVAGGVCGQRGLGAFVQWCGVKFCFSCGVKKRNTNARRVRRSRSLQQERGANSLARLIIRCGVVPKVLHNNMVVPLCPRCLSFFQNSFRTNKQTNNKHTRGGVGFCGGSKTNDVAVFLFLDPRWDAVKPHFGGGQSHAEGLPLLKNKNSPKG